MKRSLRTAFKWGLRIAILSLTASLPVSVWGALISPSGGETGIVMIREVLSTHVWTGGGVSNDWHDGANWTDGVPANGAVATINSGSVRLTHATADLASFTLGQGATLTIEGWQSAINAAEIVVAGTLTHAAQTVTATNTISGEWIPQHRIWLKGTDFILTSTGKLNADEKGYGPGCGPGGGLYSNSGAGYGGNGGAGFRGRRGAPSYGTAEDPWQPGSGGLGQNTSGSGGGAIRIEMTGPVVVNGKITACGSEPVSGSHRTGGSGGGITILCKTFQGASSGRISVDGGRGYYYGANSGGGRIALHYDPTAQAAMIGPLPGMRFSAYAAQDLTGWQDTRTMQAQMGTLYLPDTALLCQQPEDDVVLSDQRFWYTRLYIGSHPESWSPASLTMTNCVIGFRGGSAYDTGIYEGFDLNVAGDLTLITDLELPKLMTGNIESGLYLYAARTNELYGARLNVGGNLMVGAGSAVYPWTSGYSGAVVGIRVAQNVTVAAGGRIDAKQQGFMPHPGNLNGPGAGKVWSAGGSYGGMGQGDSRPAYGLAALPLELGSPGGYNQNHGIPWTPAGKGGGAIQVLAGGTITIDGLLDADGGAGGYYESAAGSGGSIFLTAMNVSGSGTLRARGFDGNRWSSGHSGGGRIAVWTRIPLAEAAWRIAEKDAFGLIRHETLASFTGALNVSGGISSTNPQAGDGTAGFYAHDDTLFRDSAVVDEPLGARYSLGMTLWHLGHQIESISAFHDLARQQGLTPEALLPPESLLLPENLQAVLVEPERLDEAQLNGWKVAGDFITSGTGDQGPTVTLPLHITKPGFYRFWVGYSAWASSIGVTSLRLYRAGEEHLGPFVQPDEFYDQRPATNGPAWHSFLVDLPAGDFLVKIGHVTRWWHGTGSYAQRRVDCLYLTEQIWAEPPSTAERQAWRGAAAPDGIQWNLELPLTEALQATWRWWQLRPISWEEAGQQPELFALSRSFWQQKIETLAEREYEEATKPDYREPERQVVFNEDWNLVANPVRARRQIDVLTNDVNLEPSSHTTLWHDIGSAIDGLRADGTFDPTGPYANHGSWTAKPGELFAGYGTPKGTVTTRMQVPQAGTYHLWVRSNPVNLSYTAPWFGRVSVDGQEAFTYHHAGTLSNIWMRMGSVTLPQAGEVSVDFILNGAGSGGTYRRVHTLLLTDDLDLVPQGTIRPPWTRAQYDARALEAGAVPGDNLLTWVFDDPYVPLSQEVWADAATRGRSWPEEPVPATGSIASLQLPRESVRAIKIGLRNLTDLPKTVAVGMAPLQKGNTSFPDAMDWRVVAFVPDGTEKQTSTSRENWHPFFLLRRPDITVPPLNVAGLWVTVNTHGVPEGTYDSRVVLREASGREYAILLTIHVSPVVPAPKQPVLVDGFTQPHEGEAYLQDFVDHGMNVWSGLMSREEMQRWGIHLLRFKYSSTNGIPEWYANIQSLGLTREDYFVGIKDEPGGQTVEALKPYIDVATALHEQAPDARVSFNPSEGAELATFEVLAPYCDFWIPYTKHVFSPYYNNTEKKAIYQPKPWMWYTTPCLSDKTARQPGIRSMPSQRGHCVGVAFFALNYPWRDQWDAGYEHIRDASTMGAVRSRHGPVATIVWEQIREAKQEAELAMMVREKLGATIFDEVTDPEMQSLISDGSTEALLAWLDEKWLEEQMSIKQRKTSVLLLQ